MDRKEFACQPSVKNLGRGKEGVTGTATGRFAAVRIMVMLTAAGRVGGDGELRRTDDQPLARFAEAERREEQVGKDKDGGDDFHGLFVLGISGRGGN